MTLVVVGVDSAAPALFGPAACEVASVVASASSAVVVVQVAFGVELVVVPYNAVVDVVASPVQDLLIVAGCSAVALLAAASVEVVA